MAEVFLCEIGQLTDESRQALREAGIVVVEVADPSRCQFIRAGDVIPADDLLWAATNALATKSHSDSATQAHRSTFALNVFSLIEEQRAKRIAPARAEP